MGLRSELREFHLGRILTASWRRGRNGSGVWFGVATVLTVFRLMRHLSKRKHQTVFRQELQLGQSIRIEHHPRDAGVRP